MVDENKFCVYFHICKHTNRIMYIGSGSLSRAYNFSTRTEEHKEYSEHLDVLIVKEGLDIDTARQEEDRFLRALWSDEMFNIFDKVSFIKEIKYEDISKYYYYNEYSPSKISKLSNGKFVGIPKTNNITINGVSFCLSRIVYSLYNKVDVDRNKIIGFKDGNKLNFSGENLEILTRSESNRKIKTLDKRNSSGVNGVWWDDKNKSWRVCYGLYGKVHTKYFSTRKYLNEMSLEEAKDLVFKQAVEYREQVNSEILGI